MSKHTPGPWELMPLKGKYYGTKIKIGNGSVTVWGTERGEGTYIASQREIDKGWTPDHGFDHVEVDADYANARLIAAAPELLEALHHISLCSQNSMSSKDECGRIARAAIAKAEGSE